MKTQVQFAALLAVLSSAGAGAEEPPSMPPVVVSRVVETFKWQNPFSGGGFDTPKGYHAACDVTATFHASQHRLRDLKEPPPMGLGPYGDALKYFFGGRPFPGSWDGVDATGMNRDVMMMEYKDVPQAVKDWIEEQKKDDESDNRFLFGVYRKSKHGEKIRGQANMEKGTDEDKVLMFAAGAIYEILPLWVADGSGCKEAMMDLSRYSAEPKDKAVVAWPVYRTEPRHSDKEPYIVFNVKAQVLERVGTDEPAAAKAESKAAEKMSETGTTTEADVKLEKETETTASAESETVTETKTESKSETVDAVKTEETQSIKDEL